jgi:hypothetical protein
MYQIDMQQLATKSELYEGLTSVRKEIGDLRAEMSKSNTNNIKWMFIFWITQIGIITSILFALLKLYFHQ